MKNKMKWVLTALSLAALLVAVLSCKAEVDSAPAADTTAPAAVTNVNAQAGDNQVVLTWSDPADADLYGIRIAYTSAGGASGNIRAAFTDGVLVAKGAQTYIVTGLTNGTEYTFSVYAVDTSQNESAAVTAGATPTGTGDTTPPANVTNLTATNKDAAVLLTWTDATAADVYGYEVSWNGTGAINRAATSTAVATGSMIVAQGAGGCYISNLVNGTSYTFTVKSVDTSGNKSAGVTKTITPEAIDSGTTLGVSLKADTTAVTNGDVTVTVTVTSADSIKTVAYKNSVVASASALFALGAYSATNTSGYTTLTATNGTYTFTVSANGSFTAAALDTAGREECAYITVSNIDKTAPAKVTNLAAGYSSTGSTLTVTWTKPADSDLNHYSFLCTDTTDSGATVKSIDSVDAATTTETLTASADSIVEGHTYSITVYAYDTVGNRSSAATTEIVTAATAAITGISVSRTNYSGQTHVDTIMTDRSMTATITGSNLALASGLYVKIKNVSAGTIQTASTAATSSDTVYTFTFDALATAATYSVQPYTAAGAVSGVTATFTVTAPADVTSIALGSSQIITGTGGEVEATFSGTNFDIRGTTIVKVLDSSGTLTGSAVTVPSANGNSTSFTADLPVPTDEGYYTVTVYFDGVADTTTATLWIYGSPKVTQVTAPVCGTKATSATVPVTITGTSFSGVANVTNTISVQRSGSSEKVSATIASAVSATANLEIPTSSSGTYTLTVYINGTASAVTGTLTVLDCTGYDAGDVILDTTTSKPVAVLAYYTPYGEPYGLGLWESSLAWAPSSSAGYSTNFTAIQSSCSGSSGSYTFTGDTDGSDNWEEVCKVDTAASTTAATNYPAFNYANTYGSTYCSGTSFTSGWYLPSAAELYALYKNRTALNNWLAGAGGTKFRGEYWSSSQCSDNDDYAWYVDFYYGDVYNKLKFANKYVRVVRAFNNLTNVTIAAPAVSSMSEIPACSTAGGTLPVTVYGAYLNANSDTVTVTCNGTDYNATLYGSYAAATVTIPTTAGSYDVTVKLNGTEKLTSTLVCKTYDSATYAVGNILCSDGSVVTKAAFNSGTMTAVAVVCGGTNAYGAPLAVGLSEGSSLAWASSDTTGYTTSFTATVCTPSTTGSGAASTATFTGDTYGGDNWNAVCAADGTASANAAANYPAFNYANKYTAKNYTDGWYVPSISELCTLYRNMATINESLTTVGGTQIGTNYYCSSSQSSDSNIYAWSVYFSNGYVFSYDKEKNRYVRVIRAF